MTTSPATAAVSVTVPDPARDDFIDFLYWLAENGHATSDVIYAVEKPHKHTDLYLEYLDAGGPDR